MIQVIKRDGRMVPFEWSKITDAILKAYCDVREEKEDYPSYCISIAKNIEEVARECDNVLTVEDIQDLVEDQLMEYDRLVAKAYIKYRQVHNIIRNSTDTTILEYLRGDNEYWEKENSNKDSKIVTTQRDYIAGITSTDIAKRFLLPKDVVKAHKEGIIHQHDMDYMAQNALTNCCLINLEDMLDNGTNINGVNIDPQNRLLTATTVATQIITAVASSQYGGTTITLTHLAPYVRKSFYRHYKKGVKYFENKELDYSFHNLLPINENDYKIYSPKSYDYAMDCLKSEIRDAVQTFNYQINSMSTTNGQAPFLSVFMWVDENPEYKEETAMLIEEFLNQRILGMKNEKGVYVTPAFPKLLYVLDENNIYEKSEYWELTKLAAKCTAKRMVPDYISAKKMREYKINPNNNKGEVYGCMGCRSFLTPDRTTKNYAKAKNYNPEKGKYYGRFNMGVTTINLVDVALSSNQDFNKFWKLLDERCELCHKGLRARINRLEKVTSNVAPILWQSGAFARLEKDELIYELLHHGYATVSLGYAGLYECVKYMTGKSHSDGEKGEEFGLKVMQFLNDKCNQWKIDEDIDYSVYGSPIESTTYKFASCLKERFGNNIFLKLDGKDRNYVTNSYHIPVFEKIDAFSKLKIESKFQKLSPGGAISYIETANLTNNIEAVLQVLQFIYDNIMYAELNTKSDYCQVCGYDGEIQIQDDMTWKCPNCNNTDQNKMNVARRTCGYIGAHFWNYGRTQEIKERYVHLGNDD